MAYGVVRIGHRLDSKTLLRQLVRNPFSDQDLVFYDQDADRTPCFGVLFHRRFTVLSA